SMEEKTIAFAGSAEYIGQQQGVDLPFSDDRTSSIAHAPLAWPDHQVPGGSGSQGPSVGIGGDSGVVHGTSGPSFSTPGTGTQNTPSQFGNLLRHRHIPTTPGCPSDRRRLPVVRLPDPER